jgi:hypothetical protein
MKKTTIIVKDANLGEFLNEIDATPNLENLGAEDLEKQLSKEFDIQVIQKEMESLGEENLKDLFAKLHALPDDELQDTLRTCPTIREAWYKHFVEWTFANVP